MFSWSGSATCMLISSFDLMDVYTVCICSDVSGSGSALYVLFAFLDWAPEWV